jgi:DNA-binding transcriptional LysR family regulator
VYQLDINGVSMDALHGLHAFTSVVENGSFTAAAHALGQTKSAISKQVAELEQRLGARLLNRTTRRMSPTEVGQVFYERCRRIIAELEEAERAVTELHTEPRGTLRINSPMSFGTHHPAGAIADFMALHPYLSVDMHLNDRLVDVTEEGYDVAIRITQLPDSSSIARKLAPFRRAICANPA